MWAWGSRLVSLAHAGVVAQSKLQLADALKQRIRVGKHAQDMEHGLHILVREQIEILERQLGRTGKKPAKGKKPGGG